VHRTATCLYDDIQS